MKHRQRSLCKENKEFSFELRQNKMTVFNLKFHFETNDI